MADDDAAGVIAIAGSAGAVEALKRLAAGLRPDLPYAILIALHMAPGTPSVLGRILDRSGPLPATQALHGERLRAGHVYVAVPDHHLLVHHRHLVVSKGPTENGHRPALNALFRSAAVAFGPRSIGMLLSGVLDDGVLGLAAIHRRGGVTIVQDPADALFAAMPVNALSAVPIHHSIPAAAAGGLFADLTTKHSEEVSVAASNVDPTMELENRIAMGSSISDFDAQVLGPPSPYVCPDCNGSLAQVGAASYRCHIGHAWTADSLLVARDEETDRALGIAVRSLREKAELARAQAGRVRPGPLHERYVEIARESEHAVDVLRDRMSATVEQGRLPDEA